MKTPLLINPLTNPMLEPLALLLLSLFVGVALLLLLVQRPITARNAPMMKVLWQRYCTWLIIALLFAGSTVSGPLPLAVLCAFICWQGGKEYALLTAMPGSHRAVLVLGGWATLIAVLLFGPVILAFAPILAFFTWSLLALKRVEETAEIGKRFTIGIAGLWGYLYLGWLPAYLLVLCAGQTPGLVLAVGLGVALSDVGAFCTGKLIGGPKLAPYLSPKKTWGGVPGNILGAALALLLIPFALPGLSWWQRALFALTIGLGSIWGDLLKSLLKRQHGVKDAGMLLPGFGGLLDRIDSLLLVTPMIYYLAQLLIR